LLSLTRRRGEVVVIPEHDIEVHVVDIKGGRVVLGFVAPYETEVHRREVWMNICNQEAKEGHNYGTQD
jgi:carbon storage regulator